MTESHANHLYPVLMRSSKSAFDAKLFTVAYHTLTAAMYAADSLKDSYKLSEIESLAREQYEELARDDEEATASQKALTLSLYQSLIQMVKTRLMLTPTRS